MCMPEHHRRSYYALASAAGENVTQMVPELYMQIKIKAQTSMKLFLNYTHESFQECIELLNKEMNAFIMQDSKGLDQYASV